jgi:hypothetical protein
MSFSVAMAEIMGLNYGVELRGIGQPKIDDPIPLNGIEALRIQPL